MKVTIIIGSVNDAPSFIGGPDQNLLEDAGPQSIEGWATNISPGPENESHQTVEFVRTELTNPGLFLQRPTLSDDADITFSKKGKVEFGGAEPGRKRSQPQNWILVSCRSSFPA